MRQLLARQHAGGRGCVMSAAQAVADHSKGCRDCGTTRAQLGKGKHNIAACRRDLWRICAPVQCVARDRRQRRCKPADGSELVRPSRCDPVHMSAMMELHSQRRWRTSISWRLNHALTSKCNTSGGSPRLLCNCRGGVRVRVSGGAGRQAVHRQRHLAVPVGPGRVRAGAALRPTHGACRQALR